MNEEIIQQAMLAIKTKLRELKKGPGQRFAQVAIIDVQARFSGGYFIVALNQLMERGLIANDPSDGGRFFILTEDGYLWLMR